MSQRQHILICPALEGNTAWLQSLTNNVLLDLTKKQVTAFLSNHAQSTHSPKMYGTVRLDAAAAEGMAKTNNDFGRGHEALVTG